MTMSASLRPRLTAMLAACVLVAGCGVGVSIGIGDDGDDPPSVSLAAASTSVPAGATLRVVAAAADDFGVDHVDFYRQDGNQWVLVASDRTEPYEALIAVPADGRTELALFARATDDVGQQGDSAVVVVGVVR